MNHHHRALDSFGENVNHQRDAKGLTGEKQAKKTELDPTCSFDIERVVRNPNGAQFFRN